MSERRSLLVEALTLGLYGSSPRPALCARQRDVLGRILACGSGNLGAHWRECQDCGHAHLVAHSCRDRHCPRCQLHQSVEWLERQTEALLPVPYFHLVFTLPHQLHALIRQNPKPCLKLLFDAASSTLLDFGRNNLGAQLGMTAVLHSWGQNMAEHYHLHVIVPGGGLSLSEDEWIEAEPGKANSRWLFSTRALSRVYQARYLEGLRACYDNDELEFHGVIKHWAQESTFAAQLRTVSRRKWNVYAKAPFGGPKPVLKYLSLYTHRVAISERRIVEVDRQAETVRFNYKDYADKGRWKPMVLSAVEFVRRFAQHILPRGFCKIRHYGLLSTRNRKEKIAICRVLLGEGDGEGGIDGAEDHPGLDLGAERGVEAAMSRSEQLPANQNKAADGVAPETCPECGSTNLIWRAVTSAESSGRDPPEQQLYLNL